MLFWLLAMSAQADDDVVLAALDTELARTLSAWEGQEMAPYFISYRVEDEVTTQIVARSGALASSQVSERRLLDVQARVGSFALDNTHQVRGGGVSSRNVYRGTRLPLDGDEVALQAVIWSHTAESIHFSWRVACK